MGTTSYVRGQSFAVAIIDLGLVIISSLLRLVYILKLIPDLLNFDLDILPLKLLQLLIQSYFKIEIIDNYLLFTAIVVIIIETLLYLLLIDGTKEVPDSNARRSLKICLWLLTRLISFILSLLFILIEGREKNIFGFLYMLYRAYECFIVMLLFRQILEKSEAYAIIHVAMGFLVIFFPELILQPSVDHSFVSPAHYFPDGSSFQVSILMALVATISVFTAECALVTLLFCSIIQRDPVKCDIWVKIRFVLLVVGIFGYVFEMTLMTFHNFWNLTLLTFILMVAVTYRVYSLIIVRSFHSDLLFVLNGYDLGLRLFTSPSKI